MGWGMASLPVVINGVRGPDPACRSRSRTAELILNSGISAYWLLIAVGVVTLAVASSIAFSTSEPILYRLFSFVLVGLLPATLMFLLAILVRSVLTKMSDLFDPTETKLISCFAATIRIIKHCSLRLSLFRRLFASRYSHRIGSVAQHLGRFTSKVVEGLTAPIRLIARLLLRHAAAG